MKLCNKSYLLIICFLIVHIYVPLNVFSQPEYLKSDNKFVIISKQINKGVIGEDDKIIVYGTMDITGNVLIKPQYKKIIKVGFNLIAIENNENKKWAYFSFDGKQCTDFIYDEIKSFSKDSLARIQRNKLWGFTNISTKEVIEAQYDYVLSFSDGLAAVVFGEKYGYIDRNGTFVINPTLDVYSSNNSFRDDLSSEANFSNGFTIIKKANKYGFIDKNGKIVISPRYDVAFPFFKDGIAIVGNKIANFSSKGSIINITEPFEYFLIGKQGNMIGDKKFLYMGRYNDKLISAAELKLMNRDAKLKELRVGSDDFTKILIKDVIKDNPNSLYLADGKKFGFIDLKGNWVIKPNYNYWDETTIYRAYFSNGYALMPKGTRKLGKSNKYNFIDINGNYINDDEFSIQYTFEAGYSAFDNNGFAIVGVSDNDDFIESTSYYDKNTNTTVTEKNTQYFGFINTAGKFIIPPKFNSLTPFYFGVSEVRGNKDCQNLGSCYIDLNGRYIYYDDNAKISENIILKK